MKVERIDLSMSKESQMMINSMMRYHEEVCQNYFDMINDRLTINDFKLANKKTEQNEKKVCKGNR